MKLKRFEDSIDNSVWDMTSNTNVNFKQDEIVHSLESKHNWRKWILSLASIFIILLTTSVIYFYNFNGPKTIFEKYYTSKNIIDVTRGGDETIGAVEEFQEKDFKSASFMFNEILQKDSNNISVRFYYGISCIETGNYDESVKSFQYIIDNNDNLYIEHAQWYLGLCYLKNEQKNKAIEKFKSISLDPDNCHQKEAENILKDLK